jgi:hypothetical protein
MNCTRTDEFCTIERTSSRTLLRLRHAPALLPGPLTSPRECTRALRGLAEEIASRLNEGRVPMRRATPRRAAPAAWLPLALLQK